jgi:phospholipid/cholesterol/gamma-HCH transport system permease protein
MPGLSATEAGVSEILLEGVEEGERLRLAASGAWTAENARHLETLIDAESRRADAIKRVDIDMGRVDGLGTFGAWLLERLSRSFTARGCETRVLGLKEDYRPLMDEVHGVKPDAPAGLRSANRVTEALASIGQSILGVGQLCVSISNMLGALTVALLRVAARPRRFRFTSMVHQLDNVGWRAVPIILLITFLIGCIIAQQGIFHFRKFGADIYVVDMVGILVLRELGVLIVAIMVAGRSGSAYTAELGAMKMREEIDALRTMGFDPIEVLILPRIIALIIGVPVLTFLGSMAALYGGGLVCWLYGGIDPEVFLSRLKEAITLDHFKVGMIKAPFMALVVGVVACVEGLSVKGSAESLGLQTTASVVESIFLVIVLDGLFAIFFASIGM